MEIDRDEQMHRRRVILVVSDSQERTMRIRKLLLNGFDLQPNQVETAHTATEMILTAINQNGGLKTYALILIDRKAHRLFFNH